MIPRNDEPSGYWPARAALLCLRAAFPPDAAPSEIPYALMPDEQPLSVDVVARALALMPKPIWCIPERLAEVLALRCRSSDERVEIEHHQERIRRIRAYMDRVHERYRGASIGELVIHVRGPGEDFLLSASEVEHVLCDYEIVNPYPEFGYGCGIDDPDREARALGADAILKISGGPSSPWADVLVLRT